MKKFFWGIVIFFSCLFFSQHVLAVSYDIESYKGDLQIHSDNTATFVEIVDYRFSSHYNGQVITLGTSGKVVSPRPILLLFKSVLQVVINIKFIMLATKGIV